MIKCNLGTVKAVAGLAVKRLAEKLYLCSDVFTYTEIFKFILNG